MPLIIDIAIAFLFGLIGLGIVIFLRTKKRKSGAYLVFFSLFYAYLFKVLDYTLFQFQSLLVLRLVMPGLMLRGQEAGHAMSLVPLLTLTTEDMTTSLLNILLFIPFGLGLPFITNVRMRNAVAAGALVSIVIELLQLATGLAAGITFRIADVNDVIFNTLGTAIGYALFSGVVRLSRRMFRDRMANSILRHIAERPQGDAW